MIIDGCSAHNGIQQWLDVNGLSNIHVINLQPNGTSRHQTMDHEFIAGTKKKYNYDLIWDLLEIYCHEGGEQRQIPVGVAKVRMESVRVSFHMYMMISQIWIGFVKQFLKKTL